MILNPLSLVLTALLSAPASAACQLTPYESGPKGLKTSMAKIGSCEDVAKLSGPEQQLFYEVRRTINTLPGDAKDVPDVLVKGERFLTRGELFFVRSILASKAVTGEDAAAAAPGAALQAR